MTANKVRHSPCSYQIFSMQVKAAVQVAVCKDIDFRRKKKKRHERQSTFYSLSLWMSHVTQKTYCIIDKKKIREGFMVFYRTFLNT
jgi:NAD(P)H-nitrite reductase large subunit